MRALTLGVAAAVLAAASAAAHAFPVFTATANLDPTAQIASNFNPTPAVAVPIGTALSVANIQVGGTEAGRVTYQLLGFEASFTNWLFSAGGATGVFNNKNTALTTSFTDPTVYLPGQTIAFGFGVDGTSATANCSGGSPFNCVFNGSNRATEVNFALLRESASSYLVFLNDSGNNRDVDWDDMVVRITISAVPEPGTYALLGVGLAMFGLIARRGRRL